MRHFIAVQERVHGFFRTRAELAKGQSDRGDGMTSFLATVIFVAAVAVALFSTQLPKDISDAITTKVHAITTAGNNP